MTISCGMHTILGRFISLLNILIKFVILENKISGTATYVLIAIDDAIRIGDQTAKNNVIIHVIAKLLIPARIFAAATTTFNLNKKKKNERIK